jgi:hypothetical protein
MHTCCLYILFWLGRMLYEFNLSLPKKIFHCLDLSTKTHLHCAHRHIGIDIMLKFCSIAWNGPINLVVLMDCTYPHFNHNFYWMSWDCNTWVMGPHSTPTWLPSTNEWQIVWQVGYFPNPMNGHSFLLTS